MLIPRSGLRLKALLSAPMAYGVLVPDHAGEGGVPMLRIKDLRDGSVNLDDVVRISAELSAQYRRTVVKRGDLLVPVVGSLGRAMVVTEALAGCNPNRPLARIQLRAQIPRFLMKVWFEAAASSIWRSAPRVETQRSRRWDSKIWGTSLWAYRRTRVSYRNLTALSVPVGAL